MKYFNKTFSVVMLCCILPSWAMVAMGNEITVNNPQYKFVLKPGHSFVVDTENISYPLILPKFTVIYAQNNPKLVNYSPKIGIDEKRSSETLFNYKVPSWKSVAKGKATKNLFEAGKVVELTADNCVVNNGILQYNFPETSEFKIKAELSLYNDTSDIQVNLMFYPMTTGYFSIGFSGLPQIVPEEANILFQPPIWTEKRFPLQPYFTPEYVCQVPMVMIASKGINTVLAVDKEELRFRLATAQNSRFGVMIRNTRGYAQPLIFSPVLGTQESLMHPGDKYSFKTRIIIKPGDWFDTYRYVVQKVYGLRDMRDNSGTGSMNNTIENMIDYAMSDKYGIWVKEQKGYSYETDVPGAVKNVSPVHPLELAILTDNEQIYNTRVLPMLEYFMSRKTSLFKPAEVGENEVYADGQVPSSTLGRACMNFSDAAVLSLISKGRASVFYNRARSLYEIRNKSERGRWYNELMLYKLSGTTEYLDTALKMADEYIDKRVNTNAKDFLGLGGSFWIDLAPLWIDLYELYEETGNKKYLDASVKAARLFTTSIYVSPPVPDTTVLVNQDGFAPLTKNKRKSMSPIAVPEEKVPAWRVSEIGLCSECAGTHTSHRVIFMANYPAYFLKLGYCTGEIMFNDLARWAVVGRYSSFPGYNIKGSYTTVYEKPEYPLRKFEDLNYNSFHYNHVWPMISFLIDYMISEAYTKSKGKISFPSYQLKNYAYMVNRIYGDRPGTFYNDNNVRLYMPLKLLRTDTAQVNYIAGYGNNKLYIVFLNQSKNDIDFKTALNKEIIPYDPGKSYKTQAWKDNIAYPDIEISPGSISTKISSAGITAIAINGIEVKPRFQDRFFGEKINPKPAKDFVSIKTPFGNMTGMVIHMGDNLKSAYIYTDALASRVKSAKLCYKNIEINGKWQEVVDKIYPFEFSIPMDGDKVKIEFYVEVLTTENTFIKSEKRLLE
ncbi:MAG: hypothetical protein WC955_04825 [Elusimicrobiota bacterium]